MTNLIVIMDPNYSDRLETVSEIAPVWVVSTPANSAACMRLWKSNPHTDHREKGSITCFDQTNPEDPLESLLDIVPALETHYGEVKDDELVFPNSFVLEVVGLALAENVTHALREVGFTSFVESSYGFQARK
jgi:hypothetical protein